MDRADGDAASTLQVWVDAQLPMSLARWLRTEHAVDAVHVQELSLLRARDAEIFTAARASSRKVVILTKDEDFPMLLAKRGAPPRILWARCGNVSNQELRRILLESWPRAAALLDANEPLVEIRRRQDAADA